MDKCPQKYSDCVALPEELDQTSSPKQSHETHVDEIFLQKKKWEIFNLGFFNFNIKKETYCKFHHEGVHDASNHRDVVEGVPGVFEITLATTREREIISVTFKKWGTSFQPQSDL